MRTVMMSRSELVAKVQKALGKHEDLLHAALVGYRAAVRKRLEEMLATVTRGGKIETWIDLQPPADHRADYRAALLMLEHDVREHVELDERDFQRLVLNQWSWSHVTHAVNSAYATGGVVRAGALAQENAQGAPFDEALELLPPTGTPQEN